MGKVRSIKYGFCLDENVDKKNIYGFEKLVAKGKYLVANGSTTYAQILIKKDEMCCLVCSSGTTGVHKGVMLSHENICANVNGTDMYAVFKEDDIMFNPLPMNHMYSVVCGTLIGLANGATVAISTLSPSLIKEVSSAKSTVIFTVPDMLDLLHSRINTKLAAKVRSMNKITKKVGVKLTVESKALKPVFKKGIHKTFGGSLRL